LSSGGGFGCSSLGGGGDDGCVFRVDDCGCEDEVTDSCCRSSSRHELGC
jgi:hypothetical protein